MVNVKEAKDGKYLKPQIVKESPTKIAVVINGGNYVDGKFGKKLCIGINLDKCQKDWTMNQESVKRLSYFGDDSDDWVGKKVKLEVRKTALGQESIIGYPMDGDKVIKDDSHESSFEEDVI